jgi:phosphohistidine phosphatase SixA
MKQLFLIRHAKSDWTNPELKDIERYLNERGYSNANMMAAKFNHKPYNYFQLLHIHYQDKNRNHLQIVL